MPVRANRTITLLVPADIDGETLEGFYAELGGHLKEPPEGVHLDCSLLEHASSTHINTLWQARYMCEEAGVPVKLVSVTYGLARVLDVLDLYDLFTAERDGVEADMGIGAMDGEAEAPPALSIRIAPTVEGIAEAMRELHDYLVALNHREIFAFDLETVFYEVTTNIRLHGELREEDFIEFTALQGNGSFYLRFEDPGPRFDPTDRGADYDPRKAIISRQRNGFGLAMINKLVDRISYERENDGVNVLNLEKKVNLNGGQH